MKLSKDHNLAVVNPDLWKQWHPTKNGNLTPRDVTHGSGRMVYWKCEKGHVWKAPISRRNRGSGCPYCSRRYTLPENSLKIKSPKLVTEYHPSKNGQLQPDKISHKSSRKVWWRCKKNPKHEWQAKIEQRSNGSNCPFCARQRASKEYNLATIKPEVAAMWHKEKNLAITPYDVMPYTSKKAWFECKKGHVVYDIIAYRSNGLGCPVCSNRYVTKEYNFKALFPKQASEWDYDRNGDLRPEQFKPFSGVRVFWKCNKNPTHLWSATIFNRARGRGCPHCYKESHRIKSI